MRLRWIAVSIIVLLLFSIAIGGAITINHSSSVANCSDINALESRIIKIAKKERDDSLARTNAAAVSGHQVIPGFSNAELRDSIKDKYRFTVNGLDPHDSC